MDKRKLKKWGIIFCVICVLWVIGTISEKNDKSVEADAPTTEETVVEKPKNVDVSNLELSDEDYINAIKDTDKFIGDVKVEGDKVTILFKDDMPILSEKSLVKDMAINGVDTFQKAFENSKANTVELIARSKFTDSYGNEEVKNAVNVTWNREISDKVDYSNYKNLLYQDFTKLYMISEKFSIHPAIWNKLDQEDKDNMSM